MKAKSLTYATAIERLESIVEALENNDIDIDALQSKLKEAQTLIKFCKEKLYTADKDIKNLLSTEEE